MTRTDPWPVDRTHAAPSVPPPHEQLATLLGAYAQLRSRIVSGNAPQNAHERLAANACDIRHMEHVCGVARDEVMGQALGELVKRPEFPALVLQVRALGARNAYAMHSLSAPERTRSVLAS